MGLQMKRIAEFWWCLLIFLLQEKAISEISGQFPNHYGFQNNYRHRMWSDWTNWSACSRSCGTGVRIRTRSCRIRILSHPSSLPKTCLGETTEYELCNKKNCPLETVSFLEYQCSKHNKHMLYGKKTEEWIPYNYSRKNPCELQCQTKDRQLLYSFGKVIDGTACLATGKDTSGICVNGRCMTIDCAGQLGADNQLDMCGICRGDNSTCVHFQASYGGRLRNNFLNKDRSDHYDYDSIAVIPAGAMHVAIRETSDTNFLALMDHTGKFLVNGNWKIQSPGRFKISLVAFSYNRTWEGYDTILIPGPTPYNIFILVLGNGNVPTVHYEYWISKIHKPPSRKHQAMLIKQLKPLTDYNSDKKEKNETDEENESSEKKDESVYKTGYYIERNKGYKSFYHRNKIFPSLPAKNTYISEINSVIPKKVKLNSNKSSKITPKFISTINQMPINKKYVYANLSEKDRKYEIQPSDLIIMPVPTQKTKTTTNDNKYHYERPTGIMELSRQLRKKTSYTNIFLQKTAKKKRSDSKSIKALTLEKEFDSIKAESKKIDKADQKQRRARKDLCPKCPKVKNQKKNFCSSDFVVRGTILAVQHEEGETRYELEIIQSYKNTVPMLTKEYIWTPSLCKCPRLKTGTEYIIMGNSQSSSTRKRESKLTVDKNSFIRRYNRKRARNMQKLVRDQHRICEKIV